MSLVAPYVQSKTNIWYEYPVIMRPNYFVCWDDDEPIELVVKRHFISCEDALAELKENGWDVFMISNPQRSGRRYFGSIKNRPVEASRVYLGQKHGPPDELLERFKETYEKYPGRQGVYFPNHQIG
jgi:hypothetical protein